MVPYATTYLIQFIKSIIKNRVMHLVLVLNTLFIVQVAAQPTNGTITTQEYFDEVITNHDDEKLENVDTISPELDVNLTLAVFIIKDADGNLNFERATLEDNLNIVNGYFKNIGIQFKTGSITEVPEYAYSIITDQDYTEELEVKYAVNNKINLFIVEEISHNDILFYGYTFYPTDTIRNNIFITKEQVFGNNLSALFGNFFGLMHTHDSIGSFEFVNGSNCEAAGDVICDTWADPGKLYFSVDQYCQYKGAKIDPNGDPYIPKVTNIMSDSPDNCKCLFSLEQYPRMKYYYKKYRQYLR